MNELTLYFDIEPIGIQSARFTKKGFAYQPKKNTDYKKLISAMAMQQLPPGFKIWTGAVEVQSCYFMFNPPKATPKYVLTALVSGWQLLKTTKPDLHDNVFKGLMDSLEGIVFVNDSQVCHICDAKKLYTVGSPGIAMKIREIKNEVPK